MEEIKEILLGLTHKVDKIEQGQKELCQGQKELCKRQEVLEQGQKELCKRQEVLEHGQKSLEARQDKMEFEHKDMKEAITYLIALQKEMRKEMREGLQKNHDEIRAVNQRLAVFQEEITKKVNVLFDADATRKEHLEFYDKKIPEISAELFNHSVRIKNLESKVVGA